MNGHKGRGICHVAIHVAISGSDFLRTPIPRTSVNRARRRADLSSHHVQWTLRGPPHLLQSHFRS